MLRRLAILMLTAASCCTKQNGLKYEVVTLDVAGHRVTVEVADTPRKRERGLMFRRSLKKDHGMLFVYPHEETLSFWMRNTHVPLSIAFMRSDGWICGIDDMKPQTQDSHLSQLRCKYALEMRQGWFAQHGVKVGGKVVIPKGIKAREDPDDT